MSHTEKERQLWEILKQKTNNEPAVTVRIANAGANEVKGLSMQQAGQIVRSWQNEGLVISFDGARSAMLTGTGTDVSDPTEL